MANQSKNYYAILGIEKTASADDIKRAWRKLAHQYHPDKRGGDDSKFKEINEAYYVLSDPSRRSQYDQFGVAPGVGTGSGFDYQGFTPFTEGFDEWFADILESFLGADFSGSPKRRGKDIHVELGIPFDRAYLGGREEITLNLFRPCTRCKGSGGEPGSSKIICKACGGVGRMHRVEQTFFGAFTRLVVCPECQGQKEVPEVICTTCKGLGREKRSQKIEIVIPQSIEDGETLKIAQAGEAGIKGAAPGDVYVTVRVLPDARWRREDDNVVLEEDLSFPVAVLGGTISVHLPDTTIRLKIPQGTHSGHTFRIRGKGFMKRGTRQRGDALVRVEVHVPKSLSEDAKQMIEKFRDDLEGE